MKKTSEKEETLEYILSQIHENVKRLRRIKKILAETKIRIEGEEIPLSDEVKTVLLSKITALRTAIKTETKKLLVE